MASNAFEGVCFLLASLLIHLTSGQNHQIPAVCEDRNPLAYQGIATAGGLLDAEYSLGKKLDDDETTIINIYATMSLNNATFAPGECPGDKDEVPSREMPGDEVALAFLYGKPGAYTRAYVSLRAPTRYYSLGLLAKNVAWRADENQTLRFGLDEDDDRSEECWQTSNGHQRTAFMHWQINRTLTSLLYRYSRSSRWLPGTLFVRGQSDNGWLGEWPFPFGSRHVYSQCDLSFLPLSFPLANRSHLNYTLCSRWSQLSTELLLYPWQLNIFLNTFFGLTWLVCFYFAWPWMNGKWYKAALDYVQKHCPHTQSREEFQVRNYLSRREGVEKAGAIMGKRLPTGSFPRELSVLWLLTSKGVHERAKRLINTTIVYGWCTAPTLDKVTVVNVFYCTAGLLLLVFAGWLYANAAAYALFTQPYDSTAHTWSPCTPTAYSIYPIVCAGLALLMGGAFLLVFTLDYRKKEPKERGLNALLNAEGEDKWWPSVTFVLSMPLAIGCPLIIMPLASNFILMAGFTTVNLTIHYRAVMAMILAVTKVILRDVLKVGRLNVALSPEIAMCKRAVDVATSELEASVLNECADGLWKRARQQMNVNGDIHPTSRFVGFSRANSEGEDRTDGHQSAEASLTCKLDACVTRAFLLLCERRETIEPIPRESQAGAEPCSREMVASGISCNINDPVYRTIWAKIVVMVLRRIRLYIFQSMFVVVATVGILTTLQGIIVHIGDMTNTSEWAELLLPAIIFVQSLIQQYNLKTSQSTSPNSDITLDAKSILLLLVTNIGDDVVTGEFKDGRIDIKWKDTLTEPVPRSWTVVT